MGVVYRAEQTEPLHRQVAVKVVQSTLLSPSVLMRFATDDETTSR